MQRLFVQRYHLGYFYTLTKPYLSRPILHLLDYLTLPYVSLTFSRGEPAGTWSNYATMTYARQVGFKRLINLQETRSDGHERAATQNQRCFGERISPKLHMGQSGLCIFDNLLFNRVGELVVPF